MARLRKKTGYDLNASFSDSSNNFYSMKTASNLRLWCRMTSNNPSDLGPNSLTPAYLGSPTISEFLFGQKVYKSVTTNDTSNQYITVTDVQGNLSFSSAASGGVPSASSDRSFSVSVMAKLDNLSSWNYLFCKSTQNSGIFYEYLCAVEPSTGIVSFELRDDSADGGVGATVGAVTDTGISADVWYHLVFTYDGRGGSQANYGMKIYVNGQSVVVNQSYGNPNKYVGMNPVYDKPLYIGADYEGSEQFDGKIAELAVWNKELTSVEVSAIYNSIRSGAFPVGSGIISNPVRILLQEKDSHTGSYPTIARTGDPDFSGAYQSFYDDTNTINFVGNSRTVYPTALPDVSKWVSGGIATPNILQGITTVGTASKGVADSHVSFTPGQNISPFSEDRIYIDNDISFYQVGTDKNILPGFDQRLSSKISLTVDLPFSDSSPRVLKDEPDDQFQSRMAYYSFSTKQWEYVGAAASTAGGFSVGSADIAIAKLMRGFSPSFARGGMTDFRTLGKVALPVSNYGFPFHQKFHADDQFLFCLSSTLSSPMLLEKIVYEGYVGNNDIDGQSGENAAVHSFFILRQFKSNLLRTDLPSDEGLGTIYNITASIPATLTITGTSGVKYVDTVREMVSYANVGFIDGNTSAFADYRPIYSSSSDVLLTNDTSVGFAGTSYFSNRKIRVEFVPKSTVTHQSSFGELGGSSGICRLFSLGGRGLGIEGSGRPYISPIPAAPTDVSLGDVYGFSLNTFKTGSMYKQSPYVLMPSDKLLFGWNSAVELYGGSDGYSGATLTLKSAKLTLYGTQLRNGQSVSFETNQPLNSDSIHEDLHYDNPVFDQFDVEPYGALSGSYVDLIVTGTMLTRPFGDPNVANIRKVQASVAAGQANSSGSLQRFVSLVDTQKIEYDSIVPNPIKLFKAAGGRDPDSGPLSSGLQTLLSLEGGTGGTQNYGATFPFEPLYAGAERILIDSFSQLSSSLDVQTTDYFKFAGLVVWNEGSLNYSRIYAEPATNLSVVPASIDTMLRVFFLIGPFNGSFPETYQNSYVNTVYPSGLPVIYNGVRYGLSNYRPTNLVAKFRRDRYGQFRDMLEQSSNSVFLFNNSIEHPLEVKFYSRPGKDAKGRLPSNDPSQTHSQNLSPFATSSLPYFDGDARERSDNPDITLTPTVLE